MTEYSHFSVVLHVFGSNLITALHNTISIILAKAFNSAISKSINSEFACSEFLKKVDLKDLVTQSFFCFATSLVVIQIWINSAISNQGKLPHSVKFISGELVAWSFKELTATIMGFLADFMWKQEASGERSLGDVLQGDAGFNIGEEWLFVATYGVYFGILSGIVLIVFGFALPSVFESAFWYFAKCFYRTPCSFTRTNQSDFVQEEENRDALDIQMHQPFSRETSNNLAFEFVNDCIRLSYAWCANGYVSGTLVAIFTSSEGKTDEIKVKSVGLLEIYCILIAAFGGLMCGNASRFREKVGAKVTKLGEFFIQWWATWAGLAIASLATSPGAISSRLGSSIENEHLFDLIRTILSSLFAIMLLFHASNVRVRRKILLIPISYHVGIEYGKIFSTAAVFGFAVAWEEYGNDLACFFSEVEDEMDNGISAIGAIWLYFVMVLIILLPLSFFTAKRRKHIVKSAEDKLSSYHENIGLRLEEEK